MDWGWAALALAAAAATYGAAAMSLTGFVPERLPFGRTVAAQLAGSFVKLVAPAAIGGIALNTRYLQKTGIRSGQAVASVGASQLAGLAGHLLLLFSFGLITGTQKNGDLVDLRNGSTLQKINGVAPKSATINTTATRFYGTRYVYNVTKDTSPSLSAALGFVGVSASAPGYICNNRAKTTIQAFGGVPLPLGGTGAGLPNSYCRLNPTPL